MLFKKTTTASEFREHQKEFLEEVQGTDVLQITHRGQPIRVLMTQEHYLNLLGKLAALSPIPENTELVPDTFTAEEVAARILQQAEANESKEEGYSRQRKVKKHG